MDVTKTISPGKKISLLIDPHGGTKYRKVSDSALESVLLHLVTEMRETSSHDTGRWKSFQPTYKSYTLTADIPIVQAPNTLLTTLEMPTTQQKAFSWELNTFVVGEIRWYGNGSFQDIELVPTLNTAHITIRGTGELRHSIIEIPLVAT